MRFVKLSILLFVVVIAVENCASLGPVYQKPEKVASDKALIIVYRPAAYVGWASSYDVTSNGAVITTLKNGGYFPFYTKPGKVKLLADTLENKSEVEIDIKAGQTAYVKGTISVGALAARANLQIAYEEVAEKELASCKLIPSEK